MNTVTDQDLQNYTPPEHHPKIKHVSSLVNKIVEQYKKDPRELDGFPTLCWTIFNQAFGGARPGEVISVTGDTGCGKTTFALHWIFDTLRQKRNCFLVSLEMRWDEMAKIISQHIQKKPFNEFTDDDIRGLGQVIDDIPLWLYAHEGAVDDQQLFKAIDFACRVKGCRFVIVDHMDYIRRTQAERWQNSSDVIGDFMRGLCRKAHELNCTILLIVHPTKLENKGVANREIGMDEMKGSSSIKQESDAVISIFQPDPGEPEAVIRFQKIRNTTYARNRNCFIRFRFDYRNQKYDEVSLHPEWGDVGR